MNIPKAIEILTIHTHAPGIDKFPDLVNAVTLAIEAMKRIRTLRSIDPDSGSLYLPGETEE
ncbi:hypothetical protein ES702_03789 [subsurface metagenome]